MVCYGSNCITFNIIAPLLAGIHHSQQFALMGRIAFLGLAESARNIGARVQVAVIAFLHKARTYRVVRRVAEKCKGSRWIWSLQDGGGSHRLLESVKGALLFQSPTERFV